MYHLIEYCGPFGFMKPWTAVRDGRTCSQQFVIPSTLEGICRKLGIEAILRHKLTYEAISWQQEVTHARDWTVIGRHKGLSRPRSIIERGLLVQPRLLLAVATEAEAATCAGQHICLSRNEDVLMPKWEGATCSEQEFDALPGTEFVAAGEHEAGAFLAGHNRFAGFAPQYGRLLITQGPSLFID